MISGSGSNAIIENNFIHDNSFGVAILGSNISAIVRNNRIFNNNINPNPLQAGSGINVNSNSSPAATPIIYGNVVRGNLWGITIQGIAQPNIGNVENADTSDDGKNFFDNNGHNDTLFALYNNTANHIYAENNFWSTTSQDSVAMQIFDSTDFPSLGAVSFIPFLLSNPTVSVRDFQSQSIAQDFILEQNFPNPFNPKTVIRYSLSVNSVVSLKVYNILGNEVATLLNNKFIEQGKHEIEFDASDLPSGIYFYRISVTQQGLLRYSETKKLLLLK